jgi:hypothetical protein
MSKILARNSSNLVAVNFLPIFWENLIANATADGAGNMHEK